MRVLDVGCGKNKHTIEGAEVIGIDNVALPSVDVVHDLNKPLPFKDNEFDMVICSYVLSHIENFFGLMMEIHRIAKPDALVKITVPFYSTWGRYGDPTILRPFSWKTFDYFRDGYPYKYYKKIKPTFKVIKKRLIFGVQDSPTRYFNWLINPIVNAMPKIYMRFFAWICPCEELYFELKPVKKKVSQHKQ